MIADLPTRRQEITPDVIKPYVVDQRATSTPTLPNRDAFLGATALGRADGLMVVQIQVDPSAGFIEEDLDELAYLVCMIAKGLFGHTHYHHHLPGMGRRKTLKPTAVLMLNPVELDPTGWDDVFRQGALTEASLTCAVAAAKKAPAGEAARPALSCLRRNYLNLERVVTFQVVRHRQRQARLGPASLLGFPISALLAGMATFVLAMILSSDLPIAPSGTPPWLVPQPEEMRAILREMAQLPMIAAGICLSGVAVAYSTLFRWHMPVLKLLRTAHGFYTAAQPLNQVIGRLALPGAHAQAAAVDFQPVIESLASKIAGEENRQAQLVTQLSLLLAIASLFVAIYAITDARRTSDPVHVVTAGVDGKRLADFVKKPSGAKSTHLPEQPSSGAVGRAQQ